MRVRSPVAIATLVASGLAALALVAWLVMIQRVGEPSSGHAERLDIPLNNTIDAGGDVSRCTATGCYLDYHVVVHAEADDELWARDCVMTAFSDDDRRLFTAPFFSGMAGIYAVDGIGSVEGGSWVPSLRPSVLRHAARWSLDCTAYRWVGAVPV